MAPPDQRLAACARRFAAVCGLAAHDRGALAERVGGFSLRAASAARGIGCLDRGAQGRAQRFFLVPHAVVLCGLCAAARGGAISGGGGGVRSWADVQTNGRSPAVRAASARRMASPARLVAVELALGESPAFRKADR